MMHSQVTERAQLCLPAALIDPDDRHRLAFGIAIFVYQQHQVVHVLLLNTGRGVHCTQMKRLVGVARIDLAEHDLLARNSNGFFL